MGYFVAEFHRALFLFHRDLRLHDNLALLDAHRRSAQVVPCFIFEPAQVDPHPYRSERALTFMLQSLDDLSARIAEKGAVLQLLRGPTVPTVAKLIDVLGIEAVFSNHDYTPFARKRDAELAAMCRSLSVSFIQHHDSLLHAPEQMLKSDHTPYTMFTPFFKRMGACPVARPQRRTHTNFRPVQVPHELRTSLDRLREALPHSPAAEGGRTQARRILKNIDNFRSYLRQRDFPAQDATTRLSAHLKFGTCSAREVYHCIAQTLGREHGLIRSLYWRDFFSQIALHFPHVFGHAFRPAYDRIEWEDAPSGFAAWCDGSTGFPIVDAGMRELNTTGFMHNRVRMITASFLIKDLHIDWRAGERYFATRLVDYDPAVNNGNWQWAASSGCDAQPYFRIFNPWLQQKKFDPECAYIKRWVHELADVPPSRIHRAAIDRSDLPSSYPAPLVDHLEEKSLTEQMYEVVHL